MVVLIKPRLTAFAGIRLGFLSKYRLRVDDRRILNSRVPTRLRSLGEIFLSARQLLRVRIAYHGSAPSGREIGGGFPSRIVIRIDRIVVRIVEHLLPARSSCVEGTVTLVD